MGYNIYRASKIAAGGHKWNLVIRLRLGRDPRIARFLAAPPFISSRLREERITTRRQTRADAKPEVLSHRLIAPSATAGDAAVTATGSDAAAAAAATNCREITVGIAISTRRHNAGIVEYIQLKENKTTEFAPADTEVPARASEPSL